MNDPNSFVHLTFIAFIALFPVVNPIGTAFVVMPYFVELRPEEKRAAARRIAFYSFGVCLVTLLVGHWILRLFGLSIPVVQLAGGIMICRMGWQHLSSEDTGKGDDGGANQSAAHDKSVRALLFYPLTFPLTTGAGTISVLFTLSAQSLGGFRGIRADFAGYLLDMSAILLAIAVMCLLVYFFYVNTGSFLRSLGAERAKIFDRLMAFFIFCVGLQIAINGIKALVSE